MAKGLGIMNGVASMMNKGMKDAGAPGSAKSYKAPQKSSSAQSQKKNPLATDEESTDGGIAGDMGDGVKQDSHQVGVGKEAGKMKNASLKEKAAIAVKRGKADPSKR